MKNLHVLLLVSFFSLNSFSQEYSFKSDNSSSVDKRIVEVFGAQLEELVLKDSQRFKDLNSILFDRTEILIEKFNSKEKYTKLSSVPLFNKYNPSLFRDKTFRKDSFNILKYNLEFFSQYDKVYRVDNTDFIIVIHPQILNK